MSRDEINLNQKNQFYKELNTRTLPICGNPLDYDGRCKFNQAGLCGNIGFNCHKKIVLFDKDADFFHTNGAALVNKIKGGELKYSDAIDKAQKLNFLNTYFPGLIQKSDRG